MSLYDRTVELDRWRTLRRKGLRMSDTTIEQMDGLLRRVAPGGSAYCELIARTITVIQPASERSRQPNRRRTLPTLGFTPQHFACDHSQKVLILLQITCAPPKSRYAIRRN
ncbi:uncharacterized protein PHACADRAFT_262284 [Phanerochaete carnosa HHB-10118-sp]|uniref:Uncharacterized protein n=1 Tax=Phanerochaete carnosa (strain HHB-10118-sp) TaxID=650164 RepID=K5UPZ7_PHACS|nr:uncharacterized protein PHACADRAFT_262284 [Phanerochaete carnosa HHB-10118-sp]EKM51886.1 hypothetical protein PHACADRAFT_262284 [Phanerochaete carnosa HHB-10118-sp]